MQDARQDAGFKMQDEGLRSAGRAVWPYVRASSRLRSLGLGRIASGSLLQKSFTTKQFPFRSILPPQPASGPAALRPLSSVFPPTLHNLLHLLISLLN